jgi:hypothetical protein
VNNMRKFLNSLPIQILLKIAADLGRPTSSQQEAINFIVDQAKGYRWSVDDLRARYEINSPKTN